MRQFRSGVSSQTVKPLGRMQVAHRASIPRLAVILGADGRGRRELSVLHQQFPRAAFSPRFVVVYKRWVRAIDERFSGRTARIFYVGAIRSKQPCGLTCSPWPQPSRPPRTRLMTHAPSSGMAGSPGSEPQSLGAPLPAHPRVHPVAVLRRDGLRVLPPLTTLALPVRD